MEEWDRGSVVLGGRALVEDQEEGDETEGFGDGKEERTFGVVLQDVDVAFGVDGDDVEITAGGEEGGGDDFDRVGRFAEEADLVGVLLLSISPRISIIT